MKDADSATPPWMRDLAFASTLATIVVLSIMAVVIDPGIWGAVFMAIGGFFAGIVYQTK